MDDYNDASRLVEGNFDDPRLTDYDTLLANVADLKRGEPDQGADLRLQAVAARGLPRGRRARGPRS